MLLTPKKSLTNQSTRQGSRSDDDREDELVGASEVVDSPFGSVKNVSTDFLFVKQTLTDTKKHRFFSEY